MTAILSPPSIALVNTLCPATLSALPLDAAQLARLAAMRAPDRELALGRMMYAHLHDETCRSRLVARLRLHVDLALQAHWQANRAAFISRAATDYDRAIRTADAHGNCGDTASAHRKPGRAAPTLLAA